MLDAMRTDAGVSRRRLLAGSAALGALLGLPACGSGSTSAPLPPGRAGASPTPAG
jgi:hypothetical protein